MDQGETKVCQNCKREIPATNYTIHTIHCARNIKICPVCKEPVPLSELEDHHEKLHKLLPCSGCGESVCGTDMEDHVRDSCAHTMKSCRFCALDLRRGELPAHERYCGARTELCAECGEWVMNRYRQIHLDSNHGFLRLDDDPEPVKKDTKTNPLKNQNATKWQSNGPTAKPTTSKEPLNDAAIAANLNCMEKEFKWPKIPMSNTNDRPEIAGVSSSAVNGAVRRPKRNDEVNRAADTSVDKVQKNLWASRGAVKKRPAPKPPAPPANPMRDLALQRAEQRQRVEENLRQQQTTENLAKGLPPVLSPAAKLEKLRKMDAVQNTSSNDQDYKNCLQGRVWKSPETVPAGHILGSGSKASQADLEVQREEFKNLVPMSVEKFMERFNEMQLQRKPREESASSGDRFSQIKTSLRELRRDLNEVTAPYNQNSINDVNYGEREREAASQAHEGAGAVAGARAGAGAGDDDVALPCEFCDKLIPLDDLVRHQTGCRPDLAQLRTRPPPAGPAPAPAPAPARTPAHADPLIPCEFCMESLPVYLITEHQMRCGRENSPIFSYAD